MIIIFLILLVIFVLGNKYYYSKFNDDYISLENCTIINGFFIMLVFFSHFYSYLTGVNFFDNIFFNIISKIGQLMVAPFLFFSGFGFILVL